MTRTVCSGVLAQTAQFAKELVRRALSSCPSARSYRLTLSRLAGAPTVPSCEGGVAQFDYGIPGQHMSNDNPRPCGCRPDPGNPGPTVTAFPIIVHGVAGAYCGTECDGADGAPNQCPNASATGQVHAQPMCIVRPCEMMAASYLAAATGQRTKTPGCNFSVCALACDPSIPQIPPPVPPGQPNPGYPNCPTGMTCKPVPDADFSPSSAPLPPAPSGPPGPPGSDPSPACLLALATYCGAMRSNPLQCNACLLQNAQELRKANCTIDQELQYCSAVPPPPPGPDYSSLTGICTFDWYYIWANQPSQTLSPTAVQLNPLDMVPGDIKCGYRPPPHNTTPKVYNCQKSKGCSPGVCDACCNDYITGAECQQCVADQCTESASCSLPVPPKLKGNDCTPGPGFPNCTEGVCSACCSPLIDPTTCDMCVERLCQIPDRGLPTCHTCQNRCSEGCRPATPPPPPPPPPPPSPTPPPPSPPPPLSSSPCIRFVHAIPVDVNIDVMITQSTDNGQTIRHNWTNYQFGQYSNWVNVFQPGVGTITIWENDNGVQGKQLYTLDHIPLTPGPLVVALKVAQDQDPADRSKYWPPNEPDQVETIAASYVPQQNGSASVRLFNLSPDTKLVGMTSSAHGSDIQQVKYGLSSDWEPFPVGQQTFQFFDDSASTPKLLFQAPGNLTGPPIGETQFLLGMQDPQAPAALKISSLLLTDAPEGGVCKPM